MNIVQLQKELVDFPDREFVTKLLNGLSHGFDIGVPEDLSETLECKNNKSARDQPVILQELLETEKQRGYVIGPFPTSPFDTYRINPLGIAESKYSKKKRLIVDMSAPHDQVTSSLNDMIDKDKFSLTYIKLDDAIHTIQTLGRGSWLCKTDITDAFKLIPVKKSQWNLQGIKYSDQYYFFTRLVFGCRSSPKLFDNFASTIRWIAVHNYHISHLFQLLDDFLAIDPPDTEAHRTMALLTLIFARLGVPLSSKKTVGPTHVLEYLGIILDTLAMEARLPEDKVRRIQEHIDSFLTKSNVTKRDLLSLLGHLNFASRVVIPGRSFVSYLLSLARSVPELHYRVYLTSDCRQELQMWSTFLQHWNGKSLFLMNNPTLSSDFELFTDASSTVGYGGYFQGRWFACAWPNDIHIDQTDMSMAYMEIVPIVMASLLWGKYWSSRRILFHCDNMAAVAIINKGRSKSLFIMQLMRRLTLCCMEYSFTITAEHVPGTSNSIADSLSRFQWDRFRRLAPQANLTPERCPPFHCLLS